MPGPYDPLNLGITPTADQRAFDFTDRDFRLLALLLLNAIAGSPALPTGAATETTLAAILARRGTLTARTVTADGTSQAAAIPANANRKYLSVQNPSGNTGTFWVRFDNAAVTAASPAIEVKPGTGFVMTAADFVTTGAISVLGTNAEKLTVWEA